jgi:hypothetical protein
MTFFAGLIGVFGFVAFLGFMLWWVPAPPLIAIVVLVTVLMAYDWVQTVRFGDDWSRPRR